MKEPSMDIKDILLELMAVQSDTGTSMEVALGQKIHRMIARRPYFKENPGLCGMETEDFLGRPLVWALRRGRSNKTVILSGHYDAVEIDCYGELKEFALRPEALKARFKELGLEDEDLRRALDDDHWLFGRGAADMKAGIAINLHTLLTLEDPEATVLFTAVYDEENISAGARSQMPLLRTLKERFGLDYAVCLITEPQIGGLDYNAFEVYNGGAGKLLPTILARGKLAHTAQTVEGLDAATMIAAVVRDVDLNPDLVTEDLGMMAQPPATLIMKDLKTTYDVSLPEYAAASINVLFLGRSAAPDLMKKVQDICISSFESLIDRHRKAFDNALAGGLVDEEKRPALKPTVLSLKELEERVRKVREDFDQFRGSLEEDLAEKVRKGKITLQDCGIAYMREMARASLIEEPFLAVGLVPPYHPAVCNEYIPKDISPFLEVIATEAKSRGLRPVVQPYLSAMADISYMSCLDPGPEKALMENMAVPSSLYSIPFDAMAELNIPSFNLGPRCRDCHQWTERVYMPDVTDTVPAMVRGIIAEAGK